MRTMLLGRIAPIQSAPLVFAELPAPEVAEIPIRPNTTCYPLGDANRVLPDLKNDQIHGTGVLVME